MNRRNEGFTLLELLIVMGIIGFVLAGTSQLVVSLMTAHRQQSKIAETNIEGIIGLEQLRQDLGKAGYGLPWNGLISYNEVAAGVAAPAPQLNDVSPNPPKAIVSKDNSNAPDYLVIKAANVATNDACTKWNFVGSDNFSVPWSSATLSVDNIDNFVSADRVVILTPGSPSVENQARTLVTSGVSFSSQWDSTNSLATTMTSTGIAYGIDSSTDLRMPFNRADYYVKQPATGMPQRCAVGTGILYKGVVKQDDGKLLEMPLLDCVADMQVIFRYDPNGSGSAQLTAISDISLWSAQQIRDQVKEVRVYILAHEGQKDVSYSYPKNPILVGDEYGLAIGGRSVDLSGITNWQNYRWKIYTLVVKLDSLL